MRFIYIILIISLFPINLYAQSKIRFEEVHSINSLSQNAVVCIHQDNMGFLWIGTFNGLNKYDGYEFKIYKPTENPTSSAGINRITSIREDKHGKLWVQTYDGRMYRFDPATERFLSFPPERNDSAIISFTSFYESDDGMICLTSDKSGVFFISENENGEEVRIDHIYNRSDQEKDLTSNYATFVMRDENNDYWIGTDNGINKINGEDLYKEYKKIDRFFYSEDLGNSEKIQFINCSLFNKKLWFGTKRNGLICYDPVQHVFPQYYDNGELRNLKNAEITTLKTDANNLWIGTATGKIIRNSLDDNEFRIYSLDIRKSGKNIKTIYSDFFNQVWILTEKFGITRLNPGTGNSTHYILTPSALQNLTDDERIVIYEDSKNQLWLGGQNMGIQLYDRQTDKFIAYANNPQDPSSLQSSVVECITEDREGNLWIGTNWFGKGLNRMITLDPGFQYIRPVLLPDYKIQNVIRSIFVDSKGYTWAGTKNGQIYIYDKELKLIHIIEKNPEINYSGYNVYSIYEDIDGFIWLCTKGAGIFKANQSLRSISPNYNKLSFSVIQMGKPDKNSLNNNNVYDLIKDELGRIWVATYGGGLNMAEVDETGRYNFHHFTASNSNLTSDKLRDLYIDTRGRLWLATTFGVNYIDIYKDKTLKINSLLANPGGNNSLSYNDINMIIEDARGNIWLASAGGGVNQIVNPASGDLIIKHFSIKNGLKDDYILSLVEDIYEYIWIGTESGLSRYNPLNEHIENFDKKNGLPEISFSERTCTMAPDGKVLFGTINGFYSISPEKIKLHSYTPTICLTSFQLYNKEVFPGQKNSPLSKSISFTKEITLKSDQSNFAIEFSMLSFRSPESNQYSYILEGFEEDWNYIGTEHKATYTNLPPGEYTFRVKGLSSDLSKDDSATSLSIKILPPFWKTTKAYLVYLIIISGLLFLSYRIAVRMTRLKNNLKVEHRVAESKLRFFTNISHEFRTPLTLILGPVEKLITRTNIPFEIRQQLSIVHRNSKRLLRMVNQLLDFRRVQNDLVKLRIQQIELIPFLRQIFESFEGLAEQKDIRYNFTYDRDDLKIWGDIQKLDIVIFNLLSNAFKFTPDHGSISVIVSNGNEPEDCIKILVSDTGIGIEPDKLKYIFDRFFVSHTEGYSDYQGTGIGLSLSMEYIKLHKGEILAESTPGKGTVFTVRLLTGNKHFPADVIISEREAFSYSPKLEMIEEEIPESKDYEKVEKNDTDLPVVLVVEDDYEMCSYLKNILSPYYSVIQAKDGMDGWKKANRLSPDLIIADVMMPKMDGIELTRKLKEEFTTSHIPVIMLSARSDVENQIEGLTTGAEAYLPKPFNNDLLLSYVKSLLSQRVRIKELIESTVELKPDEVRVTPKDKIFIENVIRLIEENIADPEFNVEKLVGMLFISRTLFYKKIKSITGNQPIELLRMLRLKKAAQLIETGEFNITEVAYMVGYNDIRYFSTSFKKQFGISPSQYHMS
jgi:signal transduction histidine kinase/ligand-binding sensor domain-containing protein/DNA-binding response OmpR family regulator